MSSNTAPPDASNNDSTSNKKRAAASAPTTPPPPSKKKAVPASTAATTTATATATNTTSTTMAPTARGTATSNVSKPYKGLRHFSMMVCKKVEEKGTTTYNQVADELVVAVLEDKSQGGTSASASSTTTTTSKFDEKNIRRRVYDALNVLMAMDVIAKDKKEITWKGLPTSAAHDVGLLQRELVLRQHEVHRKRAALQELIQQHVCFRNLVQHNVQREQQQQKEKDGVASSDTTTSENKKTPPDNKIPLPFIVVNTSSEAVIQCNMSRDLTDVMFDFSRPFEINDDNTILKKLGLCVLQNDTIVDVDCILVCSLSHTLPCIQLCFDD